MLKRTLVEFCKGYVFRRFEHPTRGTVETLSYPCGRMVYVAKGFRTPSETPTVVTRKRFGGMWKGSGGPPAAKRSAGGEA